MTDPNHGNSIITRLRLLVERMHEFGGDEGGGAVATLDACRAEAENLLPLADVDDIEVIVLREAAAILNGRDWSDLADKVELAADAFAYAETVPMDLDKLIMDTYGDGSMVRDFVKLAPGEPEETPPSHGMGYWRKPPTGYRNERDAEYKARHAAAVKAAR